MKYIIFAFWIGCVLQSNIPYALLLIGAIYLIGYALMFAAMGLILYCGVKLIKLIWEC